MYRKHVSVFQHCKLITDRKLSLNINRNVKIVLLYPESTKYEVVSRYQNADNINRNCIERCKKSL